MVALFRTNLLLVFSSLLLGTCFWFVWSNTLPGTRTVEIPLCFYSATQQPTAPETVQVTLAGRQADLMRLKPKQLAWHIDARTLQQGEQLLAPTAEQLFLPAAIKVVDSRPCKISLAPTASVDA